MQIPVQYPRTSPLLTLFLYPSNLTSALLIFQYLLWMQAHQVKNQEILHLSGSYDIPGTVKHDLIKSHNNLRQ